MADFNFDGPNGLVIEPTSTGDTEADVGRDLYSAWKRWVISGAGAGYSPAFAIEGGTPIGSTGRFTGTTFVFVNGWKAQAANYDHQLTLVGNLFSDDAIVAVRPVTASASVFVSASVAAQGIQTGSGLSTAQDSRLTELHRFRGLDESNPLTVTETEESAGDTTLDIGGNGQTLSTLTRRP